MIIIKCYSELIHIPTYKERFEYLKFQGKVGEETFGGRRQMNQEFYRSWRWRELRRKIVLRDDGCDMALKGFPIYAEMTIHHINPITPDDLRLERDIVFDPENLVCVSFRTHNAIHFGSFDRLKENVPAERMPNDTCPWRC